ncbi:MAG: zinc ribbon domain-containing protein YjdM [Candidatus Nucleicultricaceae bacterium]
MSEFPPCPQCGSSYVYADGSFLVCPECAHEWSEADTANDTLSQQQVVCDAHGTLLKEGDTVTLIKDLKVKGSSTVLKVGTKAKITRLLDGDHNINCRLQGAGAMELKSEFVKKTSD